MRPLSPRGIHQWICGEKLEAHRHNGRDLRRGCGDRDGCEGPRDESGTPGGDGPPGFGAAGDVAAFRDDSSRHWKVGIAAGAKGGICGLANFFPVQLVKIYELASTGNAENIAEAQGIVNKIYKAVDAIVKPGFTGVQSIGALKNASKHFMPVNVGDMRSPLPTYRSSETEIAKMIEHAKDVYAIS